MFKCQLPLLQRSQKAKGLRRWASLTPLCPCGRLSRPRTTTPFPPLPEALEFRWGLPYLLPTLLRILQEASRVRHVRLERNGVDGVFLRAPSTLCGSPVNYHGVGQVYPCCHVNAHTSCVGWSILSPDVMAISGSTG